MAKTKKDKHHGEEPLDPTRALNDRMQELLEEAPSDASAEFKINKAQGGFKGLLKIYSKQGKFVSGAQGPKFSELVDRIFRDVEAQIREWKRDRFEEAPI